MSVPPHRRYLSLQASRVFSALLVVLHHASSSAGQEPQFWRNAAVARWMGRPMHTLGSFFVLSGIVMLTAHWKDIGNPASIPRYLWKRFVRIYPIYWVVLLPVVCGQVIRHRPELAFQYSPRVILSSFLLVHLGTTRAGGFTDTNLTVAWTLFLEIVFYAVFAVMLWNRRAGVSVFACWMALSFANLLAGGLPYFCSPLNLLFSLGILVAWLLRRGRVPAPGWSAAFGGVLLVGNIVFAGWTRHTGVSNYLIAGLAAAFCLLGVAELEAQGRLRVPAGLAGLGDASYAVYLIHFPVVTVVAQLCFRLDRQLHWPIGIWIALMMAAGTGAGLLLHLYIERPLLKWLRGLHLPALQRAESKASAETV